MEIQKDEKGRFRKIYVNSNTEIRDRFQVEFNKDERDLFTDMQLWIGQSKDATTLKQWAFYGWLTISNHKGSMGYLKEKLLKNSKNNERLGLDVKTEIENNFQQKIMKLGGNL